MPSCVRRHPGKMQKIAGVGSARSCFFTVVAEEPWIARCRMSRVMPMSIVKINAISVPEGAGEELERRFSANSSKMADVPGFIGFQLLRPTAGESRYFVFTEWENEEAYQGWRGGRAFKASHE